MPLIRFNEHYLVQDGVRFLMTEDGERPVACRRLTRCDNFVEQRKHRSMAPPVVDVNERGRAILRT